MNTEQIKQLASSIEAGKLAHNSPYSDVRDAVQDTLDIILLALSHVTQPDETKEITLQVTKEELDLIKECVQLVDSEHDLPTILAYDLKKTLGIIK